MALETGNYVGDLVITNPLGSDLKSTLDDHARLTKKALRQSFCGFTGAILVTGTDGGAADVYTLTPTTALVAYVAKMVVEFTPNATNTGASTLNVSGLGAKNIYSVAGAALASGDLVSGCYYLAVYDGTQFRLLSTTKNYVDQLAFSSALPSQTGNSGKYITTDGTTASWAAVTPPSVVRQARTSNTILAAADSQNLIDITSGTFSQTFTAAATLGSGWYCYIKNSGTGDITLDPNGAETIDGLATFIMYPGEVRLVQCTGAAFTSIVLNGFTRTFTASGTFTKPPGYTRFIGLIWSGGTSGSKQNTGTLSAGGGGGGCGPFDILASSVGTTETVTIGAGGAARTTNGAGNVGGTTLLGSLALAYGSPSGATHRGGSISDTLVATVGTVGFEGGSESPDTFLSKGIWGGGASGSGADNRVPGGSIWGGGAGGYVTSANAAVAAGASRFGGSGGAASVAGNGTAGAIPAGGGGATQTGTSSGAGGDGQIRISGVV